MIKKHNDVQDKNEKTDALSRIKRSNERGKQNIRKQRDTYQHNLRYEATQGKLSTKKILSTPWGNDVARPTFGGNDLVVKADGSRAHPYDKIFNQLLNGKDKPQDVLKEFAQDCNSAPQTKPTRKYIKTKEQSKAAAELIGAINFAEENRTYGAAKNGMAAIRQMAADKKIKNADDAFELFLKQCPFAGKGGKPKMQLFITGECSNQAEQRKYNRGTWKELVIPSKIDDYFSDSSCESDSEPESNKIKTPSELFNEGMECLEKVERYERRYGVDSLNECDEFETLCEIIDKLYQAPSSIDLYNELAEAASHIQLLYCENFNRQGSSMTP